MIEDEWEVLRNKMREYIDELKNIANDDRISSESLIAIKATELRYVLQGRLMELKEEMADLTPEVFETAGEHANGS